MVNTLEISANVANLTSIFLARKNNIHTWWIGILGCTLYGILFFDVKLYADVTLQCFFIATSVYGWKKWSYGENNSELPISKITLRVLFKYALLSISMTILYGLILYYFTDASFPFQDSIILMFSILAQFLLMTRKLETWIFWIIVNLVAVPLYLIKGLTLTSVLYAVFLANAVWGLKTWNKLMRVA